MKVIIVNGFGGSGKSTFESFCQEIAEKDSEKIEITSMVKYVKEVATSLGWVGAKSLQDRKFLSDLKDALANWDNIPMRKVEKDIENAEWKNCAAIFVDAREQQDIEYLVKDYDAISVLIRRPDTENKIYHNHADDEVLDNTYEIIIENSGTLEDLKDSAELFYHNYIKEEENDL